ncbi:class I SAM-dependent methyltransferase [Brachyspira pulli]|uniref:class I SAM-dependent methyltransferase n=1 Tax=Brachyspira pulli TaxID=310721 RepID=UPI003003E79B
MNNIDFTDIENFESEILSDINIEEVLGDYNNTSLMSRLERQFVNGIIRKTKPKKILEVGVAAGAGTVLILNSIKDMPNSRLYSIDYVNNFWNKDIGYLVKEKFPILMDKWTLYSGGVSAKFMEEIGGDIDLCMMDTMHMNPGEFLDFLMVYPFLKKNCIFILHDIQTHLYVNKGCETCCALFSTLKGKKYYLKSDTRHMGFSNIGMVILDDDMKQTIYDILLLLTMHWQYNITEEDHNYTINLLKKYYDENISKIYESIFINSNNINIENTNNEHNINKQINDVNNNISNIYNSINDVNNNISNIYNSVNNVNNNILKIVNTLAWWIPSKKKREEFRNKFI